jgi:hypothetical protein
MNIEENQRTAWGWRGRGTRRKQVVDVIRALGELFEEHAPETLMALFGAVTSILLFYMIGSVLNHLFGLQRRSADLEAEQDQVMATLVGALVTEASHLRETLDNLLDESLQRSERNAQMLAGLLAQTEKTPVQVLELLKPEFAHLQREVHQAEARIAVRLGAPVVETPETLTDARELRPEASGEGIDQLNEANKSRK